MTGVTPHHRPDPIVTELIALLMQHSDKRVCVVGTTCTGKSTLLAQILGTRDQDKEVFGTVVIDCDLIVLLKICDKLLADRVAQRGAQLIDAKNMRTRIETEVRESSIPFIEFSVG